VNFRCLSCFLLSVSLWLSSVQAMELGQIEGIDRRSGELVRWKPRAGLPSLVIFVSSRCPCSLSHHPALLELFEEFGRSQDFSFVAVHSNRDEQEDSDAAYFASTTWPFEVIADPRAVIAESFRALKTPHAFVFSPTGELLYSGGVSNRAKFERNSRFFLKEVLEEIRQTGRSRLTRTQALGCLIPRR